MKIFMVDVLKYFTPDPPTRAGCANTGIWIASN